MVRERSLMVRWVVRSILNGGPIELFLVPASAPRLVYQTGMCYPVCGMVHIKEPLLLIGKSSLCGGSGFPFSLSEWSLTIMLLSVSLNETFPSFLPSCLHCIEIMNTECVMLTNNLSSLVIN